MKNDIHSNGEKINTYEIYTYNSEAEFYCGRTMAAGSIPGWEIKLILSTKSLIKEYPFFDCIITVNDSTPEETFEETFL